MPRSVALPVGLRNESSRGGEPLGDLCLHLEGLPCSVACSKTRSTSVWPLIFAHSRAVRPLLPFPSKVLPAPCQRLLLLTRRRAARATRRAPPATAARARTRGPPPTTPTRSRPPRSRRSSAMDTDCYKHSWVTKINRWIKTCNSKTFTWCCSCMVRYCIVSNAINWCTICIWVSTTRFCLWLHRTTRSCRI